MEERGEKKDEKETVDIVCYCGHKYKATRYTQPHLFIRKNAFCPKCGAITVIDREVNENEKRHKKIRPTS